jgi:hypothetical protein
MTNNTKEGFCGACVAVPMAIAGVGASAAGAQKKGNHKKTKQVLLWGGMATVILSALIMIYFINIKKCSTCR